MGRPPCCEKTGVKKGPWSPEEDLVLVSYVQKHGAGNWRAVPADNGLMRCSKSCRLRWTNYLRPGIKRGNFSDKEDKLIIELQQLLGNRWSAIASYMTDRTDNDIKNYWNTQLKKKLAKTGAMESGASAKKKGPVNKGQLEHLLQTNFHTTLQGFQDALSMDTAPPPAIKTEPLALLPKPAISPAMYACSIENIAHMLEGWMRHNASEKASAELVSNGGGEVGSGSHGGPAFTLEGSTRAKAEGAGGAGPGPSSLWSMLESWLLDDDMGHDDAGLMDLPLAVHPCEFF